MHYYFSNVETRCLCRKKIDILAPVPRRHLIDNTASASWLAGQQEIEETTESYGLQSHSNSHFRGNSLPPESSISPISPSSTLHSVHHQHSPTRARSPSFFREPGGGLSVPITDPAGGTKFFGQQELGVSSGFASNPAPQGGQRHRRTTGSQSFSALNQNRQRSKDSHEGSLEPSTELLHGRHMRHRHGQETGEHDGMGKAWIRWMHKRGIKSWIVPLLVLVSTLLKFCIGLGSYSGMCRSFTSPAGSQSRVY
jgi:hypothetical protein